jgi:hypothetical protein
MQVPSIGGIFGDVAAGFTKKPQWLDLRNPPASAKSRSRIQGLTSTNHGDALRAWLTPPTTAREEVPEEFVQPHTDVHLQSSVFFIN